MSLAIVHDVDRALPPQPLGLGHSPLSTPKKRPGAPKAKGSVRAKSGCYTCRIRRKKCDEQPDDRGQCATCVRLRLQCLGFGSKRPEWLKENNNVSVFREKIKDFLAAQGMIKGHSGANNGRGEEAQQILVLIPEAVRARASSSSPPTSPSSIDDEISLPHAHAHHHPHHVRPPRMSDVRQDLSVSAAAAYHPLHISSAAVAASAPGVHHQQQQQQQHHHAAAHHQYGGYALSDLSPTASSLPHPSSAHSLTSSDFSTSLTLPSSMSVPASHPTTVSHSAAAAASSWHGNQSDVVSTSAPSASGSNGAYHHPVNVPVVSAQSQQQQQQHQHQQHQQQQHQQQQAAVYSSSASALIAQMQAAPTSHFASSLPQSYHYSFLDDAAAAAAAMIDQHQEYVPEEEIPAEWAVTPSLSTNVFPQVPDAQNLLVQHYLAHVLKRQYLLADDSIQSFIVLTIQKSAAVRDAVCLLASLHQQSLRRKSAAAAAAAAVAAAATAPAVLALPASNEDDSTYARICLTLQQHRPGFYTEEEALTGLLVVSAFLFRGGRGAWAQFLNVATEWVGAMLRIADDPTDVLLGVSASQRFIIKTTFWFDILAATSRGEAPRFLTAYRMLWGAHARGAFIGPIPTGGGGRQELSMLDVMGADNATALALAETAELAAWKDRRAREGTLSIPDLVDRARRIEQDYLAQPSPTIPAAKLYGGGGGGNTHGGVSEDDLAVRRRLTANIFRATAKVYLHAVVSGDYPRVPEIRAGVRETLSCLQQVPAGRGALSSSVLRSVVFGICLAGCLTDEWDERQVLLQRLEEEQEEGVGNCAEARRVMECVWRRRAEVPEGAPPVCWREVVHELGGGESLLLV